MSQPRSARRWSGSGGSPPWFRRPDNTGIVMTASSHPTRPCARRSRLWRLGRWQPSPSRSPSLPSRRWPMTRSIRYGAPPPATSGPCCEHASTRHFPSPARHAGPRADGGSTRTLRCLASPTTLQYASCCVSSVGPLFPKSIALRPLQQRYCPRSEAHSLTDGLWRLSKRDTVLANLGAHRRSFSGITAIAPSTLRHYN